MRIRPFQAVYPNMDYIASPDSFFDTVKSEYPEYKKSGFFHKAPQEALYVYRIKTSERTYTGLIACADIQDYVDGHIKKHEKTLATKEQQQVHLLLSRNAVVKPVLLTYPRTKSIDKLLSAYIEENKSFYSVRFFQRGDEHTFWAISSGPLIQKIQSLFENKVKTTYIADGHHRSSTMALMYDRTRDELEKVRFDRLLCAFFPTTELEVYDYNRVVDGLNELSLTTFMAKISQIFDIEILEEPQRPKGKHELVMYVNREWFKLRWKEHVLKAQPKKEVILDANLLNEKVLHDILGIEDVRTDERIKYVEGPKGLEGLRSKTLKSESRVAFCLPPVSLSDLMLLADQDKTLPPKSTWFEPRIKNGLIVQEV